MRALYTAGILLYGFAISVAAAFNYKARLWVLGRKNGLGSTASKSVAGCIWMHCASLGEFEQGRPVLEKLKKHHPNVPILLTFFSPSGYEVRKNYNGADLVTYLPLDTQANAKLFLDTYSPRLAIFVKYEIWHNFLAQLNHQNIPILLISAIFRSEQIYFKPWGKWFRKALFGIDHIFVQDAESVQLLSEIGMRHVTLTGDTRFDRVNEIAMKRSKGALAEYSTDKMVIIAGSTWEADETLLVKFFLSHQDQFPSLRLVLVPHEISDAHVQKIKQLAPKAQLWTECSPDNCKSPIVVVNTIGMLSEMYNVAHIAYVGGGFGAGIHNILEPAAFGVPVVFGPKSQRFKEARDLIKSGGAHQINDYDSLESIMLRLIKDGKFHTDSANACSTYVSENLGATEKICTHLDTVLAERS